ncbi:MAG TPA: dihydrolipoyl dehydrogenase [Anaeromyxobacter sp.]|nr:dihydrolipoyl dehydrogenase [Anaeromyxobacter sp.]
MAEHDVIIIGGGPGGYLAAERLGAAKRKVLLVERASLGGTCLNVGCIPTKTLIASAKTYLHAKEGERFGVRAPGVSFDWAAMQAWKREVVEKLRNGVAAKEKARGVAMVGGEGRLLGRGEVEVRVAGGAAEVHRARAIILATGSAPVWPPIPGLKDNARAVDSTGLLEVAEVPRRLAVIGGGVIGVELAGLFAALGSQVEVVEMMEEIVPFMDREQAPVLRRALKGVTFRLGCRVTQVEGGTVHYASKEGTSARAEADLVLVAVGRRPVVDGFGAREAGLDLSPGGVVVDERMRTNLPGVWAVGDVTGKSLLAHTAYRMAEVAVADILAAGGGSRNVMRYQAVPWVVYGMTEAAGVGLTEQEAIARGLPVKKATVSLKASGRFCAENGFSAPGAVKVMAERESGRVVGVHLVGAYASEIVWGAAALIEQELTVRDVKELILPHPTVCEVVRDAVWELE